MNKPQEPMDGTAPDSQKRKAFATLQERLLPIWQQLEEGSTTQHTSLVVPSLSFDLDEMAKIQGVSFYEERLLFAIIRLRDPGATVIYVTSQPIHPDIVEYYLSLLRGVSVRSARSRLHMVCLYDASPQPLTRKILDRPRLLRKLRKLLGDPQQAYLTCFNSTTLERDLSLELGIPLNGVDPDLLWMGTKSGSRKVFAKAGVDQAPGMVDVHTRDEVLESLAELKRANPALTKAVVKLDESFAGAGNAIFTYPPTASSDRAGLEAALDSMAWATATETSTSFLAKLASMGGIVEEFIEAPDLRSPSAQLRVNPDGSVTLLSTHEQVLGGPTGQTYLGCRFPADRAYRALIQEQALKIGNVLRRNGVVSRFAVDFLLFPEAGGWRCLAIEINLRMGGTTPPFLALQFLTGGSLDDATGEFMAHGATRKYYYATDNLRSPAYRGLLPEDFVDILAAHHLDFDPFSETGAVFHMIGAVSQFGKLGVTCIGDTPEQADEIYRKIVRVLDQEAGILGEPDDGPSHPFEVPIRGME
jgi:hypothetical protein